MRPRSRPPTVPDSRPGADAPVVVEDVGRDWAIQGLLGVGLGLVAVAIRLAWHGTAAWRLVILGLGVIVAGLATLAGCWKLVGTLPRRRDSWPARGLRRPSASRTGWLYALPGLVFLGVLFVVVDGSRAANAFDGGLLGAGAALLISAWWVRYWSRRRRVEVWEGTGEEEGRLFVLSPEERPPPS